MFKSDRKNGSTPITIRLDPDDLHLLSKYIEVNEVYDLPARNVIRLIVRNELNRLRQYLRAIEANKVTKVTD